MKQSCKERESARKPVQGLGKGQQLNVNKSFLSTDSLSMIFSVSSHSQVPSCQFQVIQRRVEAH